MNALKRAKDNTNKNLLKKKAELDLELFYLSLKRRNEKSWTSNELRVDCKIVRDPDIIRHALYDHYKGLAQIKQDLSFDVEFENGICQEVSKMHSLSIRNCDEISKTH